MLFLVASFGENVKLLREKAGLSQTELADLLQVRQPAVWKWENNKSGLPSTPTLFRLANALRCSLDDLLQGVDDDYTRRARDREKQWNDLVLAWTKGENVSSDELKKLDDIARRLFRSAKRAEILGRIFEQVDDSDAESVRRRPALSNEERELLRLWREISPRARSTVHALLNDLQLKKVEKKRTA